MICSLPTHWFAQLIKIMGWETLSYAMDAFYRRGHNKNYKTIWKSFHTDVQHGKFG